MIRTMWSVRFRTVALLCVLVGRIGGLCAQEAQAGGERHVAPPAGQMALPVPGHQPAVVSVAAGTLPVLVATHGSFDRPDWHCETWRKIFGDRFHILCPRGILRWDSPKEPALMRYVYRSSAVLESEVTAGLGSLRQLLGQRMRGGPMIYLGFSQGAIYGSPLIARLAARFPRAVLIEGGSGFWNEATARAYARAGGQRVLLACGQAGCERRARAAAQALQRAGIATRVVSAPGTGHTYDGAVAEAIAGAVAWLTESFDGEAVPQQPGGSPPSR